MSILNANEARKAFLKEIAFALNGIPGDIFTCDKNDKFGLFKIDDIVRQFLCQANNELLDKICQIANSHKRIDNFIKKNRAGDCSYKRNFVKGVEKILSCSYYQDLIKTERSIDQDKGFCLTKFMLFIKYERIFEVINQLIDEFNKEKVNFAIILEMLQEFLSSGWKDVRNFSENLISYCDTFFDEIWAWMVFGYLKDTKSNHFFIKIDTDGKIKFDISKVPSFIDGYVVAKIHSTGEYVRNLQSGQGDCVEQVYNGNQRDLYEFFLKMKQSILSTNFIINNFVEEIRKVASEHSWNCILYKEHFLSHLQLIKELFLVSNDELWSLFALKISHILYNGHTVYENEITSVFDAVLRLLYNKTYYKKLKDLSSIKYINSNLSLISVDYNLPTSLYAVITEESFKKYNYFLNFMIHLYLARIKLQKNWILSTKLKHNSNFKQLDYCLFQSKIIAIIERLYYFYKVEIVETMFEDFLQSIKSTKDVEEVQKEHNKFVTGLLVESMIYTSPVKNCVLSLFKICQQLDPNINNEQLENLKSEYYSKIHQLYHLLANIGKSNLAQLRSNILFQINNY